MAIERKRKEFLQIDFEALLREVGVDLNLKCQEQWLPLQNFDDTNYDDNSNEDWLRRMTDEDNKFHPLIGKGLHEDPEGTKLFKQIFITDYDAKAEEFIGEWGETRLRTHLNRLFICFDAEDPRNYAKRVLTAYTNRKHADALIRYNYLIDNMPLHDLSELDTE